MSGDFPVIRLEARGLGVAVTAAFAQHVDVIKQQVDAEVKAVVETFDFGRQVRQVAREALACAVKNSVDHYFLYGAGKDMIDRLVSDTIKNRAES